MNGAGEIIAYNQNDIRGILQVCDNLRQFGDVASFDNFARIYGKNKIIRILNARGFPIYNIAPQPVGGIIDKISCAMINKATHKNFCLTNLYSPYYYVTYAKNKDDNIMDEQKIQIFFTCLVDNTAVDIKRKWTIPELEKIVTDGNAIVLNVKKKQIPSQSLFGDDLQQIEESFVLTAENGFLKKNIFPSIKFYDCLEIMENIHSFEAKYENLANEELKVKKQIASKILEYEAENQQIVISSTLDDMKKDIQNRVELYQKNQEKLSKVLSLNQELLESLSNKKVEGEDFDFAGDETKPNADGNKA